MIEKSSAMESIPFKGNIDFRQKNVFVKFNLKDRGRTTFSLNFAKPRHYIFKIQCDHVRTPVFVISSVIEGDVDLVQSRDKRSSFYRGRVRSQYSLIDYKPVPELGGNFEIRKGKLIINLLAWEGNIVKGYLRLFPPFDCDLDIRLDDVPIQNLMKITGWTEEDFPIEGTLDGQIHLSGFLDNLLLEGKLVGAEGVFEDLQYDNFVLNFSGIYPRITLDHSVVAQSNGLVFQIEGSFDISKVNSHEMAREIGQLKFSPLVDESIERREWTIKRSQKEGSRGLTEFKYRLQNKDVSTPYGVDADMLGVERKIRF